MTKDIQDKLRKVCNEYSIDFKFDYELKNLTTFRVGGNASMFIRPQNIDQATLIQKTLCEHNVEYFILGGGSNILVSDHGYNGVILQLSYPEVMEVLFQSNDSITVQVPASMRSALAARKISEMGYTGFEYLTTIPGTLGGAITQNAGCYGREIRDNLISVEISKRGKREVLTNSDMHFSYRDSVFKNNPDYLIHSASFEFQKGDPEDIKNKIQKFKDQRKTNQPREKRNAGSIFKNPEENNAWVYIQQCGLQGISIGNAEVSQKHANFILNYGGATSKDIYNLIKIIQEKVYEKFRVNLELEIILLGDFE